MDLLAILFPQVRAQVLRLLFADPAAELHLRELTRRSGLALGTIQTELTKLATTQLVVSERDGNRRYYRANAAHPLFPTLQRLVLQTTPGAALPPPTRNPELETLNRPARLATANRQRSTEHRPPSRNPEPETPSRPAPPVTLTLNEFD